MTTLSRRAFALFLAAPLLIAGCSQRVQSITMRDAASLGADALLTTMLGSDPARRSVMSKPEPPLMEKDVYETVYLATDEDAFVRVGKGAISDKDVKAVEKEIARISNDYMKNSNFAKDYSVQVVPFPVDNATVPEKTLVATFTPTTEEGGSPADRSRGKGKTYVLFRLNIINPRTGSTLRVREFYSGRDAGVKPN